MQNFITKKITKLYIQKKFISFNLTLLQASINIELHFIR